MRSQASGLALNLANVDAAKHFNNYAAWKIVDLSTVHQLDAIRACFSAPEWQAMQAQYTEREVLFHQVLDEEVTKSSRAHTSNYGNSMENRFQTSMLSSAGNIARTPRLRRSLGTAFLPLDLSMPTSPY
ncbi:hypothetical protein HDU86_001493 [Geranomyces michiganensis]|nr:hypothetical protein HDU86_001493 [Geranomyces michiganensis]